MGEDPCEALDLVVSYVAALIFALFDSASDANEVCVGLWRMFPA
jgi:hypothetical protein